MKNTLANIYFILCLTGYALSQTLLSPLSSVLSRSTMMSWGYHIFSLGYAFIVWLYFRNEKIKHTHALTLTIVFFVLYTLRMFYDLEITQENLSPIFAYKLQQQDFRSLRFQTYVYVLLLTILKIYVLLKCINYIDQEKCQLYLSVIGIITILLSTTSGQYNSTSDRLDGNVTLTSIYYSTFIGIVLISSSFYLLKKISFVSISAISFIFILCIRLMFLTGSRGPVFSIIAAFSIALMLKTKHKILSIYFMFFVLIIIPNIVSAFYSFLDKYFPIFYDRIYRDNRIDIYDRYISEVKNHPWGFQLDFLGYSHNMFIDSFMMFGFIGGLIIPIIFLHIIYQIILYRKNISFVSIVLLFIILCHQTSGILGTDLGFWSAYLYLSYSVTFEHFRSRKTDELDLHKENELLQT